VTCWGDDRLGQLGVASAGGVPGSPALTVDLGGQRATAVAAGANHTCALQSAQVKCWGFGGAGRLGAGDARNRGDGAARPIAPVIFP
jgi:alpha-tubulin suppressor-like RCC1 family protein